MIKAYDKCPQGWDIGLGDYVKPTQFANQLLYNRDICDAVAAQNYLYPSRANLCDSFLTDGMLHAVERVIKAIKSDETIAIFGDFDVDGLTAAAIMTQTVTKLGGKAIPYIPHRLEDGHGLSHATVSTIAGTGAKLIITVDTGISSIAEIELANKLGMETIVTDHHRPPGSLPPAVAILSDTNLSGSGLAFRFARAILSTVSLALPDHYFALAALGTIADGVSVLNDNRIIVTEGLKILASTENPGLASIVKIARQSHLGTRQPVDIDFIRYQIAPRINAPGRLASALPSLNLLNADNLEKAQILANHLDVTNKQRQQMTANARKIIDEEVTRQRDESLIVFELDKEFFGVVGLLAGKLARETGRPAMGIMKIGDDVRASLRNDSGLDIHDVLVRNSTLFNKFGGHKNAGGFSAAEDKLEKIISAFRDEATNSNSPSKNVDELTVDAKIDLDELSTSHWDFVEMMEPFGENNPEPLLAAYGMRLKKVSTVGKTVKHLRGEMISKNDKKYTFIGFNMGRMELPASTINAVLKLKTDYWNGRARRELELVHVFTEETENLTHAGAGIAGQMPLKLSF